MSVSVTPCKRCDSRCTGCHAKCDEYKEWRAEFDKAKKAKIQFDKDNDVRTEAYFRRTKRKYPVRRRVDDK